MQHLEPEFQKYYRDFSDSFNRYKIMAKKAKEDREKDIVIQRFLYTYTIFLSFLPYLLKKFNVICRFPSDCIKKAVHFGLISGEKLFLEMLDDKYELTQFNNQKVPDNLYQRISIKYVIALGSFLERIEAKYINSSR